MRPLLAALLSAVALVPLLAEAATTPAGTEAESILQALLARDAANLPARIDLFAPGADASTAPIAVTEALGLLDRLGAPVLSPGDSIPVTSDAGAGSFLAITIGTRPPKMLPVAPGADDCGGTTAQIGTMESAGSTGTATADAWLNAAGGTTVPITEFATAGYQCMIVLKFWGVYVNIAAGAGSIQVR